MRGEEEEEEEKEEEEEEEDDDDDDNNDDDNEKDDASAVNEDANVSATAFLFFRDVGPFSMAEVCLRFLWALPVLGDINTVNVHPLIA